MKCQGNAFVSAMRSEVGACRRSSGVLTAPGGRPRPLGRYVQRRGSFDRGGYAVGLRVATEGSLAQALHTASREGDKRALLDARLPNRDSPAVLERFGRAFRQGAQKME